MDPRFDRVILVVLVAVFLLTFIRYGHIRFDDTAVEFLCP